MRLAGCEISDATWMGLAAVAICVFCRTFQSTIIEWRAVAEGAVRIAALNVVLLLSAYRSFKALDSGENKAVHRWLSFWIVYLLFAIARSILAFIHLAAFIPFYAEASFVFVAWLAFGGGAERLYTPLAKLLRSEQKGIDRDLRRAAANAEKLEWHAQKVVSDVFKSHDD